MRSAASPRGADLAAVAASLELGLCFNGQLCREIGGARRPRLGRIHPVYFREELAFYREATHDRADYCCSEPFPGEIVAPAGACLNVRLAFMNFQDLF